MPFRTVLTGSSTSPATSKIGLSTVLALLLSLLPVSVFIVASAPGEAAAAPPRDGTLDKTFDDDGIALTEITSDVEATDTAVQTLADGSERILAVVPGRNDEAAIWRFLPDGSLDTDFSNDGVESYGATVLSRIGISPGREGRADGFVEAAGATVTRYLANGRVDQSFDGDGTAYLSQGTGPPSDACPDSPSSTYTLSYLRDVGVQSDRSVVVAGSGIIRRYEPDPITGECTAVERLGTYAARLTPTGEVARVVGIAQSSGDLESTQVPHRLAVTDDDHVVVSIDAPDGSVEPPPDLVEAVPEGPADRSVGVLRLQPNLDLDTSFGANGIVTQYVEPSAPAESALPVVAHSDGSVVVGLEICCRTSELGTEPPEWQLVRWGDDGSALEAAYAGFAEAEDTTVGDLVELDDTSLVMTGEIAGAAGPTGLGLASFDPAIDDFVVEADVAKHPGPPPTGVAGASVVQLDDGSLRVSGRAEPTTSLLPDQRQVMLAKVDEDLVLDRTFDPDGDGFLVHSGGSGDRASSVIVRADREVVAAGGTLERDLAGDDIPVEIPPGFVLRHRGNGSLDSAFSSEQPPGIDIAPYRPEGSESGVKMEVEAAAVDRRGRIVVAGYDPYGPYGVVQRLRPDGGADPTFNGGAPLILDLGDDTTFRDVVVDDRGRIVAVGDADAAPDCSFSGQPETVVAVRLRAEGAMDTTFGDEGVVRITPDPPGSDPCRDSWYATAQAVDLDRNGRIVIAGESYQDFNSFDTRLLVARLLNNGDRDPAFQGDPILGDGVLIEEELTAGPEVGKSIAVTDDGRIVVGGYGEETGSQIIVARYRPDGSRDEAFGGDGLVLAGLGPYAARLESIAIDSFGNIVGAGSIDYYASPCAPTVVRCRNAAGDRGSGILLVRLTPDGAFDTEFGSDSGFGSGGVVITEVGEGMASAAQDVAIAKDGAIVVAGYAGDDRGSRALVARYHADRKVIHPPPTPRPALTLQPAQGPTATFVEVSGARYVPGVPVRISMGDTLIGSLQASDVATDGSFTATVQVPEGTAAGAQPVVACQRCGASDEVSASATFTVTTTVVRPPPPPPSLELRPTRGPIGTKVEVSGAHYAPSLPVRIRLGGERVGSLAGSEISADGTFTTFVRVPERTPGGPQLVLACQRCDAPDEVSAPAVFNVMPELSVLPAVSRAGQVIEVLGEGFPTGQVRLTWSTGIAPLPVRANVAGRFEDWVLVFRGDTLGPRELQARVDGKVVATADVLVVPGTAQPGELVSRR